MTLRLHRAAPSSEAHQLELSALEWAAPRLPTLRPGTIMRRWAGPIWTGPEKTVLVRHRALDGPRWTLTLDRLPPDGFVIEYDLGQVHRYAQPGTSRLLAFDGTLLTSRVEGALAGNCRSLGYVEDAPLPLLEALLLARVRQTGQLICVCGSEDPMLEHVEVIGRLGFIDGYPMLPRHPLDLRAHDWGIATLVRTVDRGLWRHGYSVAAGAVPDGAVSLGDLWTRTPGPGLVELRIDASGRVKSDLLDVPAERRSPPSVVRWAGAPLGWSDRRPKLWAVRASASRARAIATRAATRPVTVTPGRLGYLWRDPGPNRAALVSASHPAVRDQYVTRSALEARDLGYTVDGVLGYIQNASANQFLEQLPHEILWGSRFGHKRRYAEESV